MWLKINFIVLFILYNLPLGNSQITISIDTEYQRFERFFFYAIDNGMFALDTDYRDRNSNFSYGLKTGKRIKFKNHTTIHFQLGINYHNRYLTKRHFLPGNITKASDNIIFNGAFFNYGVSYGYVFSSIGIITEFEINFIKYFYRALNADNEDPLKLKIEDWNRGFYNNNFNGSFNVEKAFNDKVSFGGSIRILLNSYKNIYHFGLISSRYTENLISYAMFIRYSFDSNE